jgi:hypothetical protein
METPLDIRVAWSKASYMVINPFIHAVLLCGNSRNCLLAAISSVRTQAYKKSRFAQYPAPGLIL